MVLFEISEKVLRFLPHLRFHVFLTRKSEIYPDFSEKVADHRRDGLTGPELAEILRQYPNVAVTLCREGDLPVIEDFMGETCRRFLQNRKNRMGRRVGVVECGELLPTFHPTSVDTDRN